MSLAVGGFAGKIGAIVTPLIAQVSFKDNILILMKLESSLSTVPGPSLATPFYTLLTVWQFVRLPLAKLLAF